MLAYLAVCFGISSVIATVIIITRPTKLHGRHRGTPGQLLQQEAQRTERVTEHNRNAVVADFMEYGWTREQAEAQL